jgi:uncharacterized membrane protein YccF (DUF307 family)
MNTPAVQLKSGPHILVRAAWYVLVGWWLSGIVMVIAWIAAVVIVGLPLTFWLVNRVPTLLTLRPRHENYVLVAAEDGTARYRRAETQQTNTLIRVVYFILVGWWLSAIWIFVSYVLMLTIIGIPFGLMMVNRLPFIFSLHRGYA